MRAQNPASPAKLNTRQPFTYRAALEAGIGPQELRTARYRRIFRGVYIEASVPDTPAIRAQAAILVHPSGAFASHMSAARLWALPVPTKSDEHVSVQRPEDRRRRVGLVSHIAPTGVSVVRRDGVLVSSPVDTFASLGGMVDLVDLVCVGDSIVRRGWATPADLCAACANSADIGAGRAQRAAAYVRSGIDSPMETRVRLLIVLAGLPEPEVNIVIRNHDGSIAAQLDLGYRALKIAILYDGRLHADDLTQWEFDIEQRDGLVELDWRVLIVTSKGVFKVPGLTLDRIYRALKARGATGLPRQVGDGWRPYFNEWR
jgi:hypothetical protein